MVLRLLFLCLFTLSPVFAQQKTFRFIDSENKRGVADAYVYADSLFVAATDREGYVKISTDSNYNFLTVDHIIYEKRVIPHDSLALKRVFYLKKQDNVLDEVIIDEGFKVDTLGHLQINFSWDDEVATFIPYKQDGYISKLRFRVINVLGVKGLNFLPFKANLYEVDSITKLPGRQLLKDDIVVRNPNGDKWAVADVSPYKIEMPESGLFVAFIIPPSEEGLYKTDFVKVKETSIAAVPALKIEKAPKGSFSCVYESVFTGNGWSEVEWRKIKRGYYKMEIELTPKDNGKFN